MKASGATRILSDPRKLVSRVRRRITGGGIGRVSREMQQRGWRSRTICSVFWRKMMHEHTGWQPHPVLYGRARRGRGEARAQRNAFPGVYLTVPRYMRQMIDRHQCFPTNAPYPVSYSRDVVPFFFLFFLYLLLIVLSRPRVRLPVRRRPVLNKRAKRYAGEALRAPLNHSLGWGRGAENTIQYISPVRCRTRNYSFVWCDGRELRRWLVARRFSPSFFFLHGNYRTSP